MDVISLDGERDESEAIAGGLGQRAPQDRKDVGFTKRGQRPSGTERHVDGVTGVVVGPRAMCDADTAPRRLPPGAGAATAPGAGAKLQLDGLGSHLD